MAHRPWFVYAAVLFAVALVLMVFTMLFAPEEEVPDPFHLTLRVAGTEDSPMGGYNVSIWVAVATGEPRPGWSDVVVTASSEDGNATVVAPQLEIGDLDGDGVISQGDFIYLYALRFPGDLSDGEVVLTVGGEVIGKVRAPQ